MRVSSSDIAGRCRCGKIHYQNKGPVLWVGHCHCSDCRQSSGSCVATFIAFKSEDFKISQGVPVAYGSSPGVSRSFCGDCGAPLAYENEKIEGQVHIRLGTLNSPSDFPASVHLFERDRLEWFDITDDARRFQTLPKKHQ